MANVFKPGNEVGKTQVTCNSLTSILINPKHEDVHRSNFSNLTQEHLESKQGTSFFIIDEFIKL